MAADEIVTRVLIPELSTLGVSSFQKLGARKYLVISIAMVAVRLVITRKVITDATIAVGSCSEVAQRLRAMEVQVLGRSASQISDLDISPELASELAPIDDVRAPAAYRHGAANALVRSTLLAAMGARL